MTFFRCGILIGESSASPVKSSAGDGNIVATHYYGHLFALVVAVTLLRNHQT